jgi:peptidyl-prolyl cis-trans isomerase C
MDKVSEKIFPYQHILTCTLTSIILLTWLLAACQTTPTPFVPPLGVTQGPDGETSVPFNTTLPTESPTQTNTPILLALIVNDESITLAEYDSAINRLLAAQPDLPPNETQARVLNELIDQLLLAQGAEQSGFVVDRTLLEERINALAKAVGGMSALNMWMDENGYSEEFFQLELRRSIAAAWMRDQIIGAIPHAAEQVHARQLLLFSEVEATDVYNQLQSGVSFDIMLAYYDPIGLGDLGWFPRGFLNETAIEEAAFSLEPGAYSQIIETSLGFHIIQLIERKADQPITPSVRLTLQEKALNGWLEQKRTESLITVLIP